MSAAEAAARIAEWWRRGFSPYSLWRPGEPGHQSTVLRRLHETEPEAVARWEAHQIRAA